MQGKLVELQGYYCRLDFPIVRQNPIDAGAPPSKREIDNTQIIGEWLAGVEIGSM